MNKCQDCDIRKCNNNYKNCIKGKLFKCPKCKIGIEHCGGNSPYYYCKGCKEHYHIQLFIGENEWRKRLGLKPTIKKKKGLEKWIK